MDNYPRFVEALDCMTKPNHIKINSLIDAFI